MDGEKNGKPLLKWMIWGENPIFGNIHIALEALEYLNKTLFIFLISDLLLQDFMFFFDLSFHFDPLQSPRPTKKTSVEATMVERAKVIEELGTGLENVRNKIGFPLLVVVLLRMIHTYHHEGMPMFFTFLKGC